MSINRFLISVFLSGFLAISFSQSHTTRQNSDSYRLLYAEAEKAFIAGEKIALRPGYSEEEQEGLNKKALTLFQNLMQQMEKDKAVNDSLAFHCYFKIGVLEHFFYNIPAAKNAYAKAIGIKDRVSAIADSFLFRPYLYLGIILYTENQFDSSLAVYKKAEKIAGAYAVPLRETERLYNTLGALYNEMGNYRQAGNYFEKALAVISPANPYYKELVINYRINLASVFTKLEEFDAAKTIYQQILPDAREDIRNVIFHNTGILTLKTGSAQQALRYLRQVNYTGSNSIRLYNDFALAFFQQGQNDSAISYLQKAVEVNRVENRDKKNVSHGQTLKQWGDLLLQEDKAADAIEKYQQALSAFYNDFSYKTIYNNPGSYSGVFSYIPLFNTLTAKADAFEKLYKKQKNTSLLEAALDAYRSAFRLANYVEKSYDSDEARLFLNKIKYAAHSKPIDISLALYELTKTENYLEETWLFDQRNKGSVISFNVSENEIKTKSIPAALLANENAARAAITRLSLKAAQVNDSVQLMEIKDAIRDREIELGKIQETLGANQEYLSRRQADRTPAVKQVQQKMTDNKTALLSYHLSETELLILCITKNKFSYKKLAAGKKLYSAVDSLLKALHAAGGDSKYNGAAASELYSLLIQPVYEQVKKSNRLVIIPDDELNYVPFEALQSADKKYLVESFSVQYQYSAALLAISKKKYAGNGVLSFAPFSSAGNKLFGRLSHSGEEVSGLKGKSFPDREATKENFISNANKFPVVHLATHAVVNDKEPDRSFIAFYPDADKEAADQYLYAREIYNLKLDSARLVFLSACQTGAGELVHGEGLMSLSRAFAYAGCPNIVTSLWKAEDKTTAFLAKKFYHYLNNGKKTDEALQAAKLDLLNSDEIDPRFKSPNYWAHLIFIGQYEPAASADHLWWFAVVLLLIVITAILFFKRKTRSGRPKRAVLHR